jgi:hypothetical protein
MPQLPIPGEPPRWMPNGILFALEPPPKGDPAFVERWLEEAAEAAKAVVGQRLGRWPARAKAVLGQLHPYLEEVRAYCAARAAYDRAWMEFWNASRTACGHGATFDELRDALPLPVHRKRPKHLRTYLEEAIANGQIRAEIASDGVRYVCVDASRSG